MLSSSLSSFRPSSLRSFIRDPGVAFALALRANTWIPALKLLPERRAEHLDSGSTALPERRSSGRHLSTNEQTT